MKAVGVVVADGTAAGGFSARGLTEEVAEVALLLLLLLTVGEADVTAEEAALLALEARLLTMAVVELAAPEEALSCAATTAKAGSSATSDLSLGRRILTGW